MYSHINTRLLHRRYVCRRQTGTSRDEWDTRKAKYILLHHTQQQRLHWLAMSLTQESSCNRSWQSYIRTQSVVFFFSPSTLCGFLVCNFACTRGITVVNHDILSNYYVSSSSHYISCCISVLIILLFEWSSMKCFSISSLLSFLNSKIG